VTPRPVPPPADSSGSPAGRVPLRVLVAEDEALIRMDLVEMLEEDGYTVVGQAGGRRRGGPAGHEHRPDLVLLDVRMPVLDGLSAAEQIVGRGSPRSSS
jgi:response regulator NasT